MSQNDTRPVATAADINALDVSSPEWKQYLSNTHPKFARLGGAHPEYANVPPPPPAPPADTRIDPRTVQPQEVWKMTPTERAQYRAALAGHEGRFGAPDTGPFRMLSVEEARNNPLGRSKHGEAGPAARARQFDHVKVPENVRAEDVQNLTYEQKAALAERAGLPIPQPSGRIHQPGEEVALFVGQKRADGSRVVGENDRKGV